MSKLKQLRIEAGLSQRHLARMASINLVTVIKAEDDSPIREYLAGRICWALSHTLKREVTLQELEIKTL